MCNVILKYLSLSLVLLEVYLINAWFLVVCFYDSRLHTDSDPVTLDVRAPLSTSPDVSVLLLCDKTRQNTSTVILPPLWTNADTLSQNKGIKLNLCQYIIHGSATNCRCRNLSGENPQRLTVGTRRGSTVQNVLVRAKKVSVRCLDIPKEKR
jgi:hypothetical protein